MKECCRHEAVGGSLQKVRNRRYWKVAITYLRSAKLPSSAEEGICRTPSILSLWPDASSMLMPQPPVFRRPQCLQRQLQEKCPWYARRSTALFGKPICRTNLRNIFRNEKSCVALKSN